MKKFTIKTHGCKANQLESQVVKEKLEAAKFVYTNNVNEAEIFILNSCSVTENADNEALRTIRNIKNKQPNILTVLTGCSAQLNHENIKQLNYIDIILGNDDKFNILDAIEQKINKITDIFKIEKFNNQFIHNYSNTRGYLKIQDGCDNYCSYCTIPYARGKSRSNTIKNIIEQINIYTEINIKEVVLTGIHIGQWGSDLDKDLELMHLLEKIESTNIKRYRLGSLNPLEISDRLLDFLSKSEKFCPHFHLSLQSLNNKTLTSMNRHYSANSCLDLMDKINSTFNLPFIGSDIIVGFPDETEEDFEVTLQNAMSSKLSAIHVFPYSIRKGTKAAEMKNQIPEKIKQYRAKTLQKTGSEKTKKFIENNIGKTTNVLIEKRLDKNTGMLKGVTPNYLNVLFECDNTELHNEIVNIKITKLDEEKKSLIGEIIK